MSEYISHLRKQIGHDTILSVGAGVYIHNDGKILLQKRKDDGTWADHGGAVDLGEKVEDAARRELWEETGLIANKLELLGVFSGKEMFHTYPNGDKVYIIAVIFLCEDYSGEINMQASEVAEMQWFDIDELPADVKPSIKIHMDYCREVLRKRRDENKIE